MTDHNRRGFLKATAVLGMAGLASGVPMTGLAAPAAKKGPIKLGVATYSLRNFTVPQMVDMVGEMGVPYVCLKSMHMPYDASPEQFTAIRKQIEGAGLTIVGGGTITIDKDTDEHVEGFFKYAKAAGMPLMVISPKPETLPRVEKFVKQYDVKVAIHNHGPEDKLYPAPADALKLINKMDPRVGLCVDVGHTTRTGTDVVRAILDAGPRVLDVHIKDLADLMKGESQCNVGRGAMPIVGIFEALQKIGFKGNVNLEYEINGNNPLPGMIESIAYMRGVLAGLGVPQPAV